MQFYDVYTFAQFYDTFSKSFVVYTLLLGYMFDIFGVYWGIFDKSDIVYLITYKICYWLTTEIYQVDPFH